MCGLGVEKGYRLVGAQRYGFNAFFVREDLAIYTLPTIKPADCLHHPAVQQRMARLDEIAVSAVDSGLNSQVSLPRSSLLELHTPRREWS